MNIGIIDADLLDNGTRHPNLALMKISGYLKEKGDSSRLLLDYAHISEYDQVYISKVFSFTKIPKEVIESSNVILGGTGFYEDGGENLPPKIEHHMPDYFLYQDYIQEQLEKGKRRSYISDYIDYSIGFTTRGCFRKCDFCVNKKYDHAFIHSSVEEFLDINRPYIYLWDDNFFAYSGWEKIFDELESTKKPFQFRQGLDIRLLTDRKARRFSKTNYHGDFIFAFDHLEDRDLIEKKLQLWRRYTTKTTKLYVLCAYESTDAQDIVSTFERIKILMKYGCLPYIMRYENYKESKWKTLYVNIARWCNQPQFFKKKSFRQFCEANQYYHKNKQTNCSAYQSLLDFEFSHPDIAQEYFDLRFDEENRYGKSYGFERKYAHKPSCKTCIVQEKDWENAYKGTIPNENILLNYFTKEIDLQCLDCEEIECRNIPQDKISGWFVSMLLDTPLNDIISVIGNIQQIDEITSSNIPQFSNLSDAINSVPDILFRSGKTMTYNEVGYYLDDGRNKTEVAQKKYGENHSKLATLLDLAYIYKEVHSLRVGISILGKEYVRLSDEEKKQLTIRLLFRIPLIQKLFYEGKNSKIEISEYLTILSTKTMIRRKSNISALLSFVSDNISKDDSEIQNSINNISGWR